MAPKYIWHVNVNCSNIERSKAFYELLGFKSVWELSTEKIQSEAPQTDGPRLPDGMGLPDRSWAGRSHIMMLNPENEEETRLDLIEWEDPRDPEPPYAHLGHLGINRICLGIEGFEELEKEYKRLVDAGVEFLSPPVKLGQGGFANMKDPDGTIIELMTIVEIPD